VSLKIFSKILGRGIALYTPAIKFPPRWNAAKKRKKPKTRQAISIELLAKKYGLKVEHLKPGRPINKT